MRVTHVRQVSLLLLLALVTAIPMFAAEPQAEVTVPVVGFVEGAGVHYRTELVITNHRDVRQYVRLSLIQDGHEGPRAEFSLEPRETKFLPTAGFPTSTSAMNPILGALRIRALNQFEGGSDDAAKIEAHAFIVADRGGKSGKGGSSRQEITGIAAAEYRAEEAVFLGVRHWLEGGAYTNVGVVNMYSEPVTFYARFQASEPVQFTVPPFSLRQIRLPGQGTPGHYVQVYPEWSLTDESPAVTTPWVAYASTIDMRTGDAYSGMRVPKVPPAFAAAKGPDVTLPAGGYLDLPNDLVYRTELMLTNHRDVPQTVRFELIANGQALTFRTLELGARDTVYLQDASADPEMRRKGYFGALRFTAMRDGAPDALGELEVNSFVVGERGAGTNGSTRQEVAGIAASEYTADEAVFLGTRHSYGTGAYTNVGIVNLSATEAQTFVVSYQYADPVTIVVPPLSLGQVRIPGEGSGGRHVRVTRNPASSAPWVSYASTVDFLTGDAFSGMRVPSTSHFQ